MRKPLILFMVVLPLLATFRMSTFVQANSASETIWIRSDGSIYPPTALIQKDGDTYTITDNIYFEPAMGGILVERSNIVIDGAGHTLKGNTSSDGIHLGGVRNVIVKNMRIETFGDAIVVYSSSGIIFCEINITNNSGSGIYLLESSGIIISGNNVNANGWRDVESGITLVSSSRNIISENNITGNEYDGITFSSSSNNRLLENNIAVNRNIGIQLCYSSNNTIFRNNVTDHYAGAWLTYSCDNEMYENNMTLSDWCGIGVYHASNSNKIYHNVFENNTYSALQYDSMSSWDDGYPSGGNYWSDYTGVDEKNGPDQDKPGKDGIGDTPYAISGTYKDNYPLMKTWVEPQVDIWYESKYVERECKVASFDRIENWVWENSVPLLLLNSESVPWYAGWKTPKDADTMLQDSTHRPDWYYRLLVDSSDRSFVVQMFGHWQEQYAWYWAGSEKCSLFAGHKWDYEPIFIYYTYTDDDVFSSLASGRIEYQYVFHPTWHGYVNTLFPSYGTDAGVEAGSKLYFWQDQSDNRHPVFTLGSSYESGGGAGMISTGWPTSWSGHAYGHVSNTGLLGCEVLHETTGERLVEEEYLSAGYEGFWPSDRAFDLTFRTQHFKRLTDNVIDDWKAREENPFKMTSDRSSLDLVDPWNEKFNEVYPSVGSTFDPIELTRNVLSIKLNTEANLWVKTPQGEGTGMNPDTGLVEFGIAKSSFSGPNNKTQCVNIVEPSFTRFSVDVCGTAKGKYVLTCTLMSSSFSKNDTYSGEVSEGEIIHHRIELSETGEIEIIPIPPTAPIVLYAVVGIAATIVVLTVIIWKKRR